MRNELRVNDGKTNIYRIGDMRVRNGGEFVLHDTMHTIRIRRLAWIDAELVIYERNIIPYSIISILLLLYEKYLFPMIWSVSHPERNETIRYERDRIRVAYC